MTHLWFIAPSLDGRSSGGTLYNRYLIDALNEAGAPASRLSVEDAAARLARGVPGHYLCDSLCLDAWPDLVHANRGQSPLLLLLHSLPSLVRLGRRCSFSDLTEGEQLALGEADGVIVTGRFAHELVSEWGLVKNLLLVEPGIVPLPEVIKSRGDRLQAVVLAPLTPEKGVLELLDALARLVRKDDPFRLTIVGSQAVDPTHAAECLSRVERSEVLRHTVTFTGELAHDLALFELARADVLVSVSRMETYGMALSEARALGLPILSLNSGNGAHHVQLESGGLVCPNVSALALALLDLVRDPTLLEERRALAEANRPWRTWSAAASELLVIRDLSGGTVGSLPTRDAIPSG